MIEDRHLRKLRVEPGRTVRLKNYDTSWMGKGQRKKAGTDAAKAQAQQALAQSLERLSKAQELLYADDRHAVLIVFQALDAAGKDGTIRHVMSGVNPQGCQVYSFKQPSAEELDHTFLWRCMKCTPERGRIGIFNRSYYEDVLVVRVHPELVERRRLAKEKIDKKFWAQRFDDINTFERHLVRNGTLVLKFYLHLSKDEQKRRFLDRLDDPKKHWKFSAADLAERAFWDRYRDAYEQALTHTSTAWAPWHIIPADQKWAARAIVADVIADAMEGLDLRFPKVSAEAVDAMNEARRLLQQE